MGRWILIITLLYVHLLFSAQKPINPEQEFNQICKIAQPGDTLLIENGVWQQAHLLIERSGTANQPIVIQAETPGQVILTGTSSLRIAGDYVIVKDLLFLNGYNPSSPVIEFRLIDKYANHSRLTQCAIINYNPVDKYAQYKWISLYGQYNRVDHCYIEGKVHHGSTVTVVQTGKPDYHLIDHNFFGYRPPLDINGGETLRIGNERPYEDSFTTVEYNYFERCNGENEIISNKSNENIYRFNTFVECVGSLSLRHGDRCSVYNNYFFGNSVNGGGVRVVGRDHKVYNNYFENLKGTNWKAALVLMNGVPNSPANRYFQVINAQVLYNTFVNCSETFNIGLGKSSELSLPPLDCTIAYNVVQSQDVVINDVDNPINMTWKGNVMKGSSLGIADQEGIIKQHPELSIADDGLYRPLSTSPIYQVEAESYPFMTVDIDSQPRIAPFTIGADQLSELPVQTPPVTAGNTGPDWLEPEKIPYLLVTLVDGEGHVETSPIKDIFDKNELVTLTAVPAEGWLFEKWQGINNTRANPVQITVDSYKQIYAIFAKDLEEKYKLSPLTYVGGKIVLNPPGGVYQVNSFVTITAIPDSGWKFKEWGWDITGNQNPKFVTVTKDMVFYAEFEKIESEIKSQEQVPLQFNLFPNYPNPFNPSTCIDYDLAHSTHVKINVYNINGRVVDTLVDKYHNAGHYSLQWKPVNQTSGIYYYQIKSPDFTDLKKMILLK